MLFWKSRRDDGGKVPAGCRLRYVFMVVSAIREPPSCSRGDLAIVIIIMRTVSPAEGKREAEQSRESSIYRFSIHPPRC